ncbi:MAG: hypothetical protein R2771_06040 [Saprospiraceae bacterium]
MSVKDNFINEIEQNYTFKGDSFIIGAAKLDNEVLTNTFVRLPLKTFNRNMDLFQVLQGLEKQRPCRIIAEQLSAQECHLWLWI